MFSVAAGLPGVGSAPVSVQDEVDPDGDEADCDDREDHWPGLDGQCDAVFADHQTPVSGWGPDPETKKAQGGNEEDGPGETQSEIHQNGAGDVRKHLAHGDVDDRFTASSGGLDIRKIDHLQSRCARYPRHPWDCCNGDGDNDDLYARPKGSKKE